ncbi:MAG: DNA-binding protein [Candidatus Norongarragalinales archaeon]
MEENDFQSEEAQKQEAQEAAQLEELRKARIAELQVKALLKQILEPEAFERIANIRAANPALYAQLAHLFLYLKENGQLKSRITDAQLREFVARLLAKQRRETKIVRLKK